MKSLILLVIVAYVEAYSVASLDSKVVSGAENVFGNYLTNLMLAQMFTKNPLTKRFKYNLCVYISEDSIDVNETIRRGLVD